jgi:hypothetical protein
VLPKKTKKPLLSMHLTEEPPLPKGYPRTIITKAQRAELLLGLRRRYRERKAQDAADKPEDKNKTPASS